VFSRKIIKKQKIEKLLISDIKTDARHDSFIFPKIEIFSCKLLKKFQNFPPV
jgi:hypothetical protein